MRTLPLLFALGLLFGGITAWRWPLSGSDAVSSDTTAEQSPAQIRLDAWDWHASPTPPALASDTARAAIAAWIGLRGPDGGPATFATRANALHALLAYLPLESYPRLLDALLPHTGSDDRDLLGIVFNLYAEHDPAAAARWAIAAPDGENFNSRWQAALALQTWIGRDAAAASAWVRSLGDPELVRSLAQPLITELAKTDPVTALQTYGPFVWDGGQGFWSLREPLSAWAKTDPARALAWLVAQPRTNLKGQSLPWWISQIGAPEQTPALLQALTASPDFPGRAEARNQLLAKWASTQPDEVMAYVQNIPERHLRNQVFNTLSASWSSETPPQARLVFVLALPDGGNRDQRLEWQVGEWAKKDPSAALAWINAQDDPAVRATVPKVQAAILGTIARDEPATALAEWQALTDPKTKTAAIQAIVEAWSQKDPGAALRWLQTQPRELAAHGTNAAYQALYPWSLKEPEAALRWAEAQPNNKAFYIKALAGDGGRNKADRAAVSELYAKIADPALRTEVLTGHVREWLAKDRPAAQAWLEGNATLTPEQAAALLAPAPAP